MAFNPSNPTDSPDFIAAAPWGSGNLVSLTAGNIPAGQTIWPVQYVGAAGAVLVLLNTSTMAGSVVAAFWGDSAMTKQLFSVSYNKSGNTGMTMDVLPVMGPWFNLVTNNSGAQVPAATLVAQLLPSYPPNGALGGFMPGNAGRVISAGNFASIGAGAFQAVKPPLNVPGAAHLYLWVFNALGEIIIQPLAGGALNEQVQGFTVGVNNITSDTRSVILPNDDYEIIVINRGGAAQQMQYALMTDR